uniref:Uncharacterized protein n=1 Tax=Trypanosoma congolense (strain IL3000) TaxID=1068625 RepID=G0UMV5_TRYCI|nr:hypothetical protein, unlikely [Trypanosoma congolense IL3000]
MYMCVSPHLSNVDRREQHYQRLSFSLLSTPPCVYIRPVLDDIGVWYRLVDAKIYIYIYIYFLKFPLPSPFIPSANCLLISLVIFTSGFLPYDGVWHHTYLP